MRSKLATEDRGATRPPDSREFLRQPGGEPTAAHSFVVLQQFLSRAAVRGERAVAIARLTLASLAFGQYLLFNLHRLAAGEPKALTFTFGLALAISYSVWTLKALHGGERLLVNLTVSVAVDAMVFATVMFGIILWPRADYGGILRVPDAAIFFIGIIAAGFRLSRRVAVVGTALFLAVEVIVILADHRLNAASITYVAEDLTTWGVFFIGSAILGYVIASRTKKLVFEGAEAAVSAERARQRLGIYVSEEVAQAALESADLRVGGRRQNAAVLFSDLRGFTSYSETLPPERLVAELNAYLDTMVRVIREEGGVVDKFMGDSIMVVFGIPTPRADDAGRAMRTAEAMQHALERHNAQRNAAGRPTLRHGIGIHYGPVVAGNIGNAERLQYTVIGDVVNIASRLESATKKLRVPVIISARTVAAARQSGIDLPAVRELGSTAVPGRDGEIEICALERG